MPRGAASKAGAKRGPNAHKLATQFPKGTVLRDLLKQDWQLGDVVGKGGFGLIYLASNEVPGTVNSSSATNVIKIEPKGNGPLYCEMHFYQRAAKQEDITKFAKDHKLQYMPVPPYISFGMHAYQGKEYRFLVMPRFGSDLQRLIVDQGGTLPPHVVFAIGLRMIDALQYMHGKGYYHADIKAANILLGYKNGKEVTNQVYLVDYGLANLFTFGGAHKEYKEDPRKAHDGTIEFTSRDAHKGVVPSRRGDFEILGYCLLQWLFGPLPWEANLKDPNVVAASKEKYMANIPLLITTCKAQRSQKAGAYASTIQKFLDEVKKLRYESEPGYDQFRTLLRSALSKTGHRNEWTVVFRATRDVTTPPFKKTGKRKSVQREDTASPSPVAKIATDSSGRQPSAKAKKRPASRGRSPIKTTSSDTSEVDSSPHKKSRVSSPQKAVPKSRVSAKGGSVQGTSRGRTPTQPKALSRSPLKANGRSPAPTPSPKAAAPAAYKAKGKKHFPMPLPSKPAAQSPRGSARSPAASKANPSRRCVRRVKTVQSDAAIQTSPLSR